jgi:hypothetical protein
MLREYKGWWIEWGCTGSLGCVREFILSFDTISLAELVGYYSFALSVYYPQQICAVSDTWPT